MQIIKTGKKSKDYSRVLTCPNCSTVFSINDGEVEWRGEIDNTVGILYFLTTCPFFECQLYLKVIVRPLDSV